MQILWINKLRIPCFSLNAAWLLDSVRCKTNQTQLVCWCGLCQNEVKGWDECRLDAACMWLLRVTVGPGPITGGDAPEVPGGWPEEEGHHHSLPEHAQRHPGPDRGAQQSQHPAVSGEQRPGGETQRAHLAVRPERGGTGPRFSMVGGQGRGEGWRESL